MQTSNTRQFMVAAIAILAWPVFSGCDRSTGQKIGAPVHAEGPANIAQQSDEHQPALNREFRDASRLLGQLASERAVQDEPTDQDKPNLNEPAANREADVDTESAPEKQTIEIPPSWKRLGKKEEIWIDVQAKEVIIAGRVCLNQGGLEMFICPEHTKEHESIIAANATALQVHLALTALGADPGKPTTWDPEYRAAFGPTIQVTLKWQDEETGETKTVSANQWIRDLKTQKAMEHLWVFGGSQFWEDPDTKEQIYYGDSGELICLSNFSTATIDLNVESSQSNEGLLFEAFTENIPPIGTKVYAIIKPGKRIEPTQKSDENKGVPAVESVDATEDKAETASPKKDDE